MRRTTPWWVALSAALGLIASGLFATPAAAAPAEAEPAKQNCGVFIETGQTICVAPGENLHQAVRTATGKTIVDAAVTGQQFAAPQQSFLMARLYDNLNFGGSYLELFYSSACTTRYIGYRDIGSAWYGRISSFRGYSSCDVKIWENTDFTGANLNFRAESSYVGAAMNDKTKSVQVF